MLTKFCEMIERELIGNSFSKFIVGEHLTIADICLASFAFNVLKNETGPFHESFAPMLITFPYFGAYIKRMQTEFAE